MDNMVTSKVQYKDETRLLLFPDPFSFDWLLGTIQTRFGLSEDETQQTILRYEFDGGLVRISCDDDLQTAALALASTSSPLLKIQVELDEAKSSMPKKKQKANLLVKDLDPSIDRSFGNGSCPQQAAVSRICLPWPTRDEQRQQNLEGFVALLQDISEPARAVALKLLTAKMVTREQLSEGFSDQVAPSSSLPRCLSQPNIDI
jgi:hypothetical protein